MKTFLLFLTAIFLFGNVAFAEMKELSQNTVLYLGENGTKEIHIQSLKEAADLLKDSRPDLSEEILKAAEIIAK